MDAQKIVKTGQEQAVAAWVDYLNQVRFTELINALNRQDDNLQDALDSLRSTMDTIKDNVIEVGRDEANVAQVAREIYKDLLDEFKAQDIQDWELYPPQPCVLSRLKRDYRYHMLIKTPRDTDPSEILAMYFRKRKPCEGVHVSVDVNPDSLL